MCESLVEPGRPGATFSRKHSCETSFRREPPKAAPPRKLFSAGSRNQSFHTSSTKSGRTLQLRQRLDARTIQLAGALRRWGQGLNKIMTEAGPSPWTPRSRGGCKLRVSQRDQRTEPLSSQWRRHAPAPPPYSKRLTFLGRRVAKPLKVTHLLSHPYYRNAANSKHYALKAGGRTAARNSVSPVGMLLSMAKVPSPSSFILIRDVRSTLLKRTLALDL